MTTIKFDDFLSSFFSVCFSAVLLSLFEPQPTKVVAVINDKSNILDNFFINLPPKF